MPGTIITFARRAAPNSGSSGMVVDYWQSSRCRWLFGCLLGLVLGCGTARSYVWVGDYVKQGKAMPAPPIRPGDRLQIVVQGQDSLGTVGDVRPDGEVVMPVVGSIVAASKTPNELANAIAARLATLVQAPVVTVVVERRRMVVSVIGEVHTSGRHELEPREGVLQVLARAGGLTPFADEDAIFVIRREPQPARIRFKYEDLAAGESIATGFELRDGDTVLVE